MCWGAGKNTWPLALAVSFLFVVFSLGATPGCVQGRLLALHSRITPGIFGGPVPGIERRLSNTRLVVLSFSLALEFE